MKLAYLKVIFLSLVVIIVLAACGAKGEEAASVEAYLKALTGKDGTRLASLSCAAWEEDAALELDSFQAVDASLQDLACEKTGADEDAALVKCTGKILTTYNQEKQELDLSLRTYRVVQEAGEQRVCGYQ
jgi:hypothetical protein